LSNQSLKVEIISLESSEIFNEFVNKNDLGSIHQITQWGEFQSKSVMRDKFWSIIVKDQNTIIASTILIKQKLPMGLCWLYSPRGPILDYTNPLGLKELLETIKIIAKAEKAVFLRVDPALEQKHKFDFQKFGFKKAHAHYQPENTLILDLSLEPEKILAQMKPKGRYNIKVAEKHGVKVRLSDGNDSDLQAFHNLLQQTTSRDGFSGHNLEYYKNMLKILGPEKVKLYLAEYKGEIIAGITDTFYKDTAIYYFGASGNQHRNVMAPYLLQWKAITDAKTAGLKHYDFLGIAPDGAINHPWSGVTDFKLKFGGTRLDYFPAQELVYKKIWYWLLLLKKKLR